MVKSLTDELSDILDWNEHATGTHDVERARAGLVTFCRGLVCGLRAADAQPFVTDVEWLDRYMADCAKRRKSDPTLNKDDTSLKERMKY